MAKYNFDVSGSQLIISLVPVLDDVQPTSMSYLAPSFKIGVGKINAYEYGQPRQSFLFTEIGEIDGVAPTDLQDAFDKLTTATANFNGGGAAPYKVYTALLNQSGTNAPVATVLENTLGYDIVWSRLNAGGYLATATEFAIEDVNKFYCNIGNRLPSGSSTDIASYIVEASNLPVGFSSSFEVYTKTILNSTGVVTRGDNILEFTPIEIRVYN